MNEFKKLFKQVISESLKGKGEKIKKLLNGGDRYGLLKNDEEMTAWMEDNSESGKYVYYEFKRDGVYARSGKTVEKAKNGTTGYPYESHDKWKDLDEDYLNYLLTLKIY